MLSLSLLTCLIISNTYAAPKIPKVELVDGQKIPILGLGTYQITSNGLTQLPNGQQIMSRVLKEAVDVGYRHFDTAYLYGNERYIGNALRDIFKTKKVKREDLFITSKVWNTFHKRRAVVRALKMSLGNFGLEYLDLALVHWPMAYRSGTGFIVPMNGNNNETLNDDIDIFETWKGMEDALKLGLAKSIGVSNFNSQQLTRVLKLGFVKPVINQIEVHPYLNQKQLVEFCHNHSIQVTAYSPLRIGDKELLNEPILVDTAAKHNKTVPQVMLRWLIQRDIVVIPKTSRRERLIENMDVFDFQLTDKEMKRIFTLNKNKRVIDFKYAINNKEYPFKIPF